nr:hypothetical protein [uncultured Draconibacterium sp.]
MELKEGTPEYEAAKAKADKTIDNFKWQLRYLIGGQFEKEPEKTQFILGVGMECGYVKHGIAKWLEEFGFKCWLNRGILGDLVIDWAHNPELPKTTITPLYEEEGRIWKKICSACK